MQKAFNAVGATREEALDADLIRLVQQFNHAGDGAMVLPSEYLEIVIRTR